MPGDRSTIFVHVGLPKTGTTFLQDMLREHTAALRAEGLHYPLGQAHEHFHAALDARGNHNFGGGERPDAAGAWARLVATATGLPGRVIISHEILATADAEHAAAAIESLRPHDVHVVVTARDPGRQIVADWAESVKHGRKQSFETYLRRAGITTSSTSRAASNSHVFEAQRLSKVLRTWGAGLPPERVHVVTVPPSGGDPGELWRRFASVLGIEAPDRFRPGTGVRRNERLGTADVELLRRVSRALDHRIISTEFGSVTKDLYAQSILPRVSSTPPPVLPESHRPRADRLAERWIRDITKAGYDVAGDLADLRPRHADGPGPDDWTDDQLIETSAAATAELLLEVAELRRTVSHLQQSRARWSPRNLRRELAELRRQAGWLPRKLHRGPRRQ
ncbi:MAG: hypothetical protein M3419_11345 [Actinomycetota bacterium]|nr:hypothetical protein [Actinomycetota bacterium]